MFFAAVPRLSANLEEEPPNVGEWAYPPIVGLLGSFASNRARFPALVLLFSDDMLSCRAWPSPASSCVEPVKLGGFLWSCCAPGVPCRRPLSSGYGRGSGPVGGGDCGAPKLEGGTRYCAHCCCCAAPSCGCLRIRSGDGVWPSLTAPESYLRNSSSDLPPAILSLSSVVPPRCWRINNYRCLEDAIVVRRNTSCGLLRANMHLRRSAAREEGRAGSWSGQVRSSHCRAG